MSAARAPVIHILNPMRNADGGSEQRVAKLYEVLRPRTQVFVWSEQQPDPRLARVPIRRVTRSQHPMGGTLVVMGFYFPIGAWLSAARPDRVILVVNIVHDGARAVNLDLVARTGRPVEMVYASLETRARMGIPGRVEYSPIPIEKFTPAATAPATFLVGRLSRDDPGKHHAEDPALYAALHEAGCTVTIMGGLHLRGRGCDHAATLLPSGAMPAERFLQSLSCFVYRTSEGMFEAYGRVVVEAMACGLPVVVERRGGPTEVIEHGKTGFLFDSTDEAREQILRLRDAPALRARIGAAAREVILHRYSSDYWEELAAYYLRSGDIPAGG